MHGMHWLQASRGVPCDTASGTRNERHNPFDRLREDEEEDEHESVTRRFGPRR